MWAHTDTMWGIMAVLIKWVMVAPKNESDPSKQFFFNFRKRSKHEKTHDGKVYEYLWIVQRAAAGWLGISRGFPGSGVWLAGWLAG